jgi:hypothetical protein
MNWKDIVAQMYVQANAKQFAMLATNLAWRIVVVIELFAWLIGILFMTVHVLRPVWRKQPEWKTELLNHIRYYFPLVISLCAVGILYWVQMSILNPAGLLRQFGVVSIWQLTPQGVTVLLQWLRILFWTQALLALTGISWPFLWLVIPRPRNAGDQEVQPRGQP